jgi:hypothetical protein
MPVFPSVGRGSVNPSPAWRGEDAQRKKMTPWTQDQLRRIGDADDLHVSPLRDDGRTFGTPTWIWSVATGGALYVRAYNGRTSRWYQAAMAQKAGRITAGGMTLDVRFEPAEHELNDRIDAAYRARYRGNAYLGAMVSERAAAATVRITPAGR